MDLIIRNGKVVLRDGIRWVDIGVKGGKIVTAGKRLGGTAKRVIDADGKLVLPGIIDAHVHFQLPVGGITTADDFFSGTRAAACGGVTTVIDFAIQKKGRTLAEAVRSRRAEADGNIAIDYSLHAVPTDWSPRTRLEMRKLAALGITSFKMYMVYEGLRSGDVALFEALEETSKFSGLVSVHAESVEILDMMIKRYHNRRDMKRYGAYCHALSRPGFVEAEAISRAITWARATGGALYIVHMSTLEGREIIRLARREGVKVFAETCPHYLLLDDSVFKRKDGHLFATCPQVKKKADSEALWEGIKTGDIQVVATDTCTFAQKQKDRWRGDFTKIPYGLPGVETLLPLLHTYGVVEKRITLRRMVEVLCENPARLMGLYPRKGAIAAGSDADLVIFDPDKKVTVSHENLQTNCDWSPYEGFRLTGYPEITISRGRVVAESGRFVGRPGHGQFVRRAAPVL